MRNTLTLSEKQWDRFLSDYEEAVKENKTTFMFLDSEILVAYAKYLIEWKEQSDETRHTDYRDVVHVQKGMVQDSDNIKK